MNSRLCLEPLLIAETVPVVQGGMQWVGYAELASAVSNAGGLGIVSLDLIEDQDGADWPS